MQGVAMAGGMSVLGFPSASGTAAAIQSGRLADAQQRREDTRDDLLDEFTGDIGHDSNDDEDVVVGSQSPVRPYAYTKAVAGSDGGFVDESQYDVFVSAIESETWTAITKENERPLVSPNSSFEFGTEGVDPWVGTMPPAPAYDSDRTKAELVDLYWMALVRDEYLEDLRIYIDSYDLGDRDDDLDQFNDTESLFRRYNLGSSNAFEGQFHHPGGSVIGPPVSQFLLADVDVGAMTSTPEIRYFSETDYGTSSSEWEEIVTGVRGGAEPGPGQTPPENDGNLSVDDPESGETRFIHTGRDLAAFTRGDPSYEPYMRAALYLLNRGAPLDPALAYVDDDDIFPYIDHGAVAVLDLVARVARNALQAAWHHKWAVHRRLRPETYAQRVEYYDGAGSPAELTGIEATNAYSELQSISEYEDSYLPLAFPEGSPAHPAYPSGHSTLGGACVTVLKALFENESLSSIDGPYHDVTDEGERVTTFPQAMTVHWELNKLLQNIGLGRCWAGVHFRTDHVYGALLGEQIAIATLLDHFEYNNNETNTQGSSEDERLTFSPLVDDEFDSSDMYGSNDWQVAVSFDTLETLRTQARNEPI
ncbi:vanadium-dependent haloperoxidase [Natronobiforma cellulositropha]|uniref:vanadium-dependent haloperoxidase n=1 Tax=Natronobiforma cellulositropha TaxID=1679076 RepID=UPI0021D5E37F|nr:vanadium-dependent haloperoxidase [Natronobiforma cellulositropha]